MQQPFLNPSLSKLLSIELQKSFLVLLHVCYCSFSPLLAPAIDIWSAGCLLAELYTKTVLFKAVEPSDLLLLISNMTGPFHRSLYAQYPLYSTFKDLPIFEEESSLSHHVLWFWSLSIALESLSIHVLYSILLFFSGFRLFRLLRPHQTMSVHRSISTHYRSSSISLSLCSDP